MRIALKFAYDGRKFHGFACQPNLRTVEGDLLNALIKLNIISDVKKSCFRLGSRTDKGVSAIGNVVAFNTDNFNLKFLKVISESLVDIITYGFAKIHEDFNPRFANYRFYRYYLKNENFDIEKVLLASTLFIGEHNFSNFARVEPNKDPVRKIENIIFNFEKNFLIIDFYAETFLWNQIRRMISALIKVGIGKITYDQILNALNYPNVKVDFGLSSAEPLILKDIIYDFKFSYSKKLLEKVKNLENQFEKIYS
jgi:tRNA pseudouridine38-40 synthase